MQRRSSGPDDRSGLTPAGEPRMTSSNTASPSSSAASSSASAPMDDLAEKAKRDAEKARDAMKDAARKAKEEAGAMTNEIKDRAEELAGHAKAAMSEATSFATEKARDVSESQKAMAARSMANVARGVHSMARDMESSSPQIAHFAGLTADSLEKISKAVQERPINQLIEDVGSFAKRQPVAFLAGSVVAGALLARFLKSTAPSAGTSAQRRSMADGITPSSELNEAGGSAGRDGLSGAGGMEDALPTAGRPARPPYGGVI